VKQDHRINQTLTQNGDNGAVDVPRKADREDRAKRDRDDATAQADDI
jgi:hypothetical protein